MFAGSPPEFVQQVFNVNPTILGLEFMKYGDVHSLLQKAGSHQKTWKSQELWFIWHCREYLITIVSLKAFRLYLTTRQSSEVVLHWLTQTPGMEDAIHCVKTLYYKKRPYP